MTQPPRVRFAPSPTGSLHIGGARTALFNWAWARRNGGTFLLRVEDTDRERSTQAFEDAILDGLKWLGIDWDEGPDLGGPFAPYRQSERLERHRELAAKLLEEGASYRCFCSSERITKLRDEQRASGQNPAYDKTCRGLERAVSEARAAAGEPFVQRFRVPEGSTTFADDVRGTVTFPNADVDDWIMVRADDTPTYNFVVVCDDADMQVTHVLRGDDHLTNTPKQVLLYRALGLEVPGFAHLPLMLGKDGKKLSKRTGDTALQDYRDKGYPPEAVVNFLCLQGWALDDHTEIFSTDELVANFSPKDVGKSGASFDPEKFLWMAGEYLRNDSLERVTHRCAPFVVAAGLMTVAEVEERKDWLAEAVASERERIHLYSELPARIAYLFEDDAELTWQDAALKNANKHAGAADTLASYLAWLRPRLVAPLDKDALRVSSREWAAEHSLKIPALFQPLRLVLTGAAGGPDFFDVMSLLGPERCAARIEAGIARLGAG